MKALGYSEISIASKYLNYAFLATAGGRVAGILIGEKIIPFVIIKSYGIMYHNVANTISIDYQPGFALIASTASVVCTVGATLFASGKELQETPASLMRPPAPKEGKRVLLERLTFIWKHLSFSWKSTIRNLFRYKKRLIMTVFGIAGSMVAGAGGQGVSQLPIPQHQLGEGPVVRGHYPALQGGGVAVVPALSRQTHQGLKRLIEADRKAGR